MTASPALKAMVEAMAAELVRQADEPTPELPIGASVSLSAGLVYLGDKPYDLEKVARAGLAGSMDGLARALCLADGEEPEAFHSRADREAQDHDGLQLTDHAIPLWMRYRGKARRAIDEILKETPDV